MTFSILHFSILTGVSAFPSHRYQLPNAFRVPCDNSLVGCTGFEFCDSIGHDSCRGGGLRNVFAQDFIAEGYEWTTALCNKDSDGDGYTNGQELGDPCCFHAYHATAPSTFAAAWTPSHPGVASSVPSVAPPSSPNCSDAQYQPTKDDSEAWNVFDSSEEQRVAEFRIDNFPIPPQQTTYIEVAFNWADFDHDDFHAIYSEVVRDCKDQNGNEITNVLHHYVIKVCDQPHEAHLHGKEIDFATAADCNDRQWAIWAPGRKILETPKSVGYPVGKGGGMLGLTVQVHYDNPTKSPGFVSNDGFKIWYTPNLRPKTIKEFAVNRLSVNYSVQIPPHRKRWFITRECKIREIPAGHKWMLLAHGHHGHLFSREMYVELRRGFTSQMIGYDRIWHFDDQYAKNLYGHGLYLQNDDIVQATCVFNTAGDVYGAKSDVNVPIGLETTDEMCWTQMFGYSDTTPSVPVEPECDGHMWMGELNDDELPEHLAFAHPESMSETVWTASSVLSGGSSIRMSGTPPVEASLSLCADGGNAADCTTWIADMSTQQGWAALNKHHYVCPRDLSVINKSLSPKTSLLNTCCTHVCAAGGLCESHPSCPTTTPAPYTGPPTTTSTTTPPHGSVEYAKMGGKHITGDAVQSGVMQAIWMCLVTFGLWMW